MTDTAVLVANLATATAAALDAEATANAAGATFEAWRGTTAYAMHEHLTAPTSHVARDELDRLALASGVRDVAEAVVLMDALEAAARQARQVLDAAHLAVAAARQPLDEIAAAEARAEAERRQAEDIQRRADAAARRDGEIAGNWLARPGAIDTLINEIHVAALVAAEVKR